MFRSLFAVAALVAVLHVSPVQAKRKPAPVVAPVTSGKMTFSVAHEKIFADGHPVGMRAYVVRTDGDTLVWRTQVYQIDFDRNLETDVQEVYLASLSLTKAGPVATNERGQIFILDAITGERQLNREKGLRGR